MTKLLEAMTRAAIIATEVEPSREAQAPNLLVPFHIAFNAGVAAMAELAIDGKITRQEDRITWFLEHGNVKGTSTSVAGSPVDNKYTPVRFTIKVTETGVTLETLRAVRQEPITRTLSVGEAFYVELRPAMPREVR